MPLEILLAKNRFVLVRQLSKGWTSFVYLCKDASGREVVVKVLREKSNRRDMARRETENLKIANLAGVGPRWLFTDFENDAVSMEYVDGGPFSRWLEKRPSRPELVKFLNALYSQARALDNIGLDHGQLAGRGCNILVRSGLPVIIDFEKASTKRKVHNKKVLDSFLFKSPGSKVVKAVREVLGGDKKKGPWAKT
ncbi:MAG TPA: hypothetical protein HA254_00160 [Candidatus Diapherotrites archaeon]|uniref:non-specific serine/threonine protein kinase n=1 Tax=Candidatus Iainarchaeum sp. TaxID=3101447 RepID=A0A7J4IU82_9ARCH|nr:hypothetical protein [Candidatus Diapherotrites archaeon]